MNTRVIVMRSSRALMMRTLRLMMTSQELDGFIVDYLDAAAATPVPEIDRTRPLTDDD